ncbi:hypothetical protein [Kribbella qitaiheensis]|uniref:hypothetical protein n=1 Tax=Kribbella qitaiheensis TaxID=1544730 RepID=UPI001625FDEB|nr:hypothetical protein [Kribbella qitaiheensis]
MLYYNLVHWSDQYAVRRPTATRGLGHAFGRTPGRGPGERSAMRRAGDRVGKA